MNRRTFLANSAGATAFLMSNGLIAATAKRQPIPDETILKTAREQIPSHRLGSLTFHLRDENGRSLKHAKIKLEQLRHEFLFGSNFFVFGNCGNPELEEQYRERFGKLFNYCTLGFYWGAYEPQRGQPNYSYTDKVVDYCQQHAITCKGHPLVWDHAVSTPTWLPADLKDVEELSKTRVREIVSRYKGRIDIWDVVNEATHLYEIKNKSRMDDLGIAMGQIEYVAQHLKIARAANPGAALLVNDYKNNPAYFKLLDSLREKDKLLFDIVGLQSHQHHGAWPLQKVWDMCELFTSLGRPIHFTETTFVSGKKTGETWGLTAAADEEKQAEAVEKFYTTLFGHPGVQAITWWDFADLGAWQGAPAGYLRNDMSPKPAYDRLLSLIKGKWWTNAEGVTGVLGRVGLRAFYGTHRVLITLANGREFNREIELRRGKEHHFDLHV
jgi:GH35 family endo-1,4-beta-xylanase